MASVGLRALIAALLLGAAAPATPLAAQDLFSPVIVVNDRAVTAYELDQRARLLEAFGTPGDVVELARTQLVDERLIQQELERVGAVLTEEGLETALADFSARAELSTEEFVARLGSQGVAYETLRDYVAVNLTWRDYIRARFLPQVEISEADIDAALAQENASQEGIEVLLSEIIIPAPPGQEGEAQALAEQLSRITSTAEFEAAAREYSATRSSEQGGRLDWTPLSTYPGALQQILLGLSPGEVTDPLEITGAVALLQLRDLREVAVAPPAPETVDYAEVRIAGGLSAAALAEAQRIAAGADTCTDLFGLGIPDANITREAVPPEALPSGLALDLAKLDTNEITWGRTENGGQTLVLTMLCARTYPLPEGAADRDAVVDVLRSERLGLYAAALIADLRAAATIVGE